MEPGTSFFSEEHFAGEYCQRVLSRQKRGVDEVGGWSKYDQKRSLYGDIYICSEDKTTHQNVLESGDGFVPVELYGSIPGRTRRRTGVRRLSGRRAADDSHSEGHPRTVKTAQHTTNTEEPGIHLSQR